jgi:type II secretory pathway pseudopilin PulG
MNVVRPSARRRPARRARGYTLLEVALVVSIVVLLVGAAIPLTSGFVREQRLRDVVRELLVLAKTARTDAMTTGRPTEIIFDKKGFGLRRPGDEEPSEAAMLPAGMDYTLRPFAAERVLRPDGQRWIFQPTGLLEPVTVRVMEGEAWIEVQFDPLTAGLADESYYIP